MAQISLSFTPEEEALIDQEYQALIADYIASPHRQKTEIIDQAFRLARHAHGLVRRRSGEPYILHPIAVARIVCKEIGLGSTSICCALLHDVVEDTEYTVEDIRRGFGDKIAQIVEGLTKISTEQVPQNIDSLQAQKTIGDDARVILIKIADRLHNMRTLGSMKPDKQLKIAGETSFFYAPLADRLGLFSIKTELEDLSFRYEHPDAYAEIKRKVEESEAGREDLFHRFAAPLKARFDSMGLSYEMKTRVKGCFSIWRKMQIKGIPFEEVYDLFAVRIIFDSQDGYPEKNRCWDIYTAITEIYRNRPDRLRDWLSTPKGNGYQALHLTVLGPDAQWVEVQIRSRRMDEIAEQGLAAHWRYKRDVVEEDHELEIWLDTIREVLNHPDSKGMEFLDTVHLSLYAHDITVFTPKGRPITLPLDASVLDFAYAVHTDLGDTCIGAKVNHKVLPLSYRLSNGDQVEILTSKMVQPEPGPLMRRSRSRQHFVDANAKPSHRVKPSSQSASRAKESSLPPHSSTASLTSTATTSPTPSSGTSEMGPLSSPKTLIVSSKGRHQRVAAIVSRVSSPRSSPARNAKVSPLAVQLYSVLQLISLIPMSSSSKTAYSTIR